MAAPTDKSKSARIASISENKVNCVFCSEAIDSAKKPTIKCDMCNNSVCLACSNLSKMWYTEISKKTDSDIEWMCKVCKSNKSDLRSIQETLNELKQSNADRLSTMEGKLTSLETNLKESVEESNRMKESVRNDLAGDIGKVRTDIAADIAKMRIDLSEELDRRLQERDDIAKRERNLFFCKVPESADTELDSRIDHDRNSVMKVCAEIGVNDPKLTAIVRFGQVARKADNSIDTSKMRPLRVSFLEKRERRLVLINSKKLKKTKDASLKNISIARDLTAEEKKQRKKLEKELEERKKETGEDLVNSRGKIVKKKPESPDTGSSGGPDNCFP